jgi:hypothetical protein
MYPQPTRASIEATDDLAAVRREDVRLRECYDLGYVADIRS